MQAARSSSKLWSHLGGCGGGAGFCVGPLSAMNPTLPLLLRHLLAAFGGWLAANYQIQVDTTNTGSLVAGILVFAAAWLWSVIHKRPLDASRKQTWLIVVSSFARQLMPALAGWLQAQGHQVDVVDPAAVILFGGGLISSKIGRRAGESAINPATVRQWTGLLLLCGSLCSCVQFGASDRQIALAEAGVRAARIGLAMASAKYAAEATDPSTPTWKRMAATLAITEAQDMLTKEQARLDTLRAQSLLRSEGIKPGSPDIITQTRAAQVTATKNPLPIWP